jgi:actin-related protein 5
MLFSYDYNKNSILKNKSSNFEENKFSNCLIISSSYQTTHVVPILNGRVNLDKTRRIGIGGFHGNELLTKSMNLRYPDLRAKFTPEIIKDIQEKYTMCAIDYHSQLQLLQKLFQSDQEKLRIEEKKRMFGSIEMYEKANMEEIIQKKIHDEKFKNLKPYRNMIDFENEQYDQHQDLIKDLIFFDLPKTGSEVVLTEEDLRRKQDVRKEQSRRLRELMQKKREENLRNLEKELQELEAVSALRNGDKYQFEEAILSKGYATYEELQNRINKIFLKIKFNKDSQDRGDGQAPISASASNEEKFDEEKRWPLLNIPEEDLTEEQLKMKKIQKMQRQAYISRLEKREKQKRERERVEELKQRDPESYLVSLYKRKKEIVDRLEKYKSARRDITSRYSKANRGRMMVLAELGKEAKEGKKGESQTDDFGINDEDWEVYRGISRHNLSEDEEEDQQMLQEIEAQIIENDTNYFKYSDDITQNLFYSSNHLTLGVDQFRGAELLFQPYIIGVDQAGLVEIILNVFKTMTLEEQKLLAGNIFITGGFAKTPYLKERLYNDLRMNLNCNIEIKINIAEDPELDAWKGARNFHINPENHKYFITKDDYKECGYDYFKEHHCSNNSIVYRGGSNFSYEVSNKKQKTI